MQEPKIFTFPLETYKTKVIVFYNCPATKIQKYLSKNFNGLIYERNPSHQASSFVCEHSNGYEEYCIDFIYPLKKNDPDSYGTIVHEAFHVLCNVFEPRGINLLYGESEVFTYPLSYIVKKIIEGVFK